MGGNETERPVVNIVGERVALGPLRRDLAPLFLRWWNDFPTIDLSGFPDPVAPYNAERLDRWLDGALTDASRAWFVIYETASWRAIGYTNLRDIDHQHGRAEFGITIGAAADRSKGYGSEATRLVLDYAFTALGLTHVFLDTVEYNPRAVRAYEKAGFRLIGRRRQGHRANGRVWDGILMDCVAEEFESPVLARLLAPEGEGG